MKNNGKNYISAKDVCLAYDGYVAAEHVSFTLSAGDYLCVVGENGSGKSTLLKAVTGEIRIAGGEMTISPEIAAEGIGYLPQQSKIQRDFPADVREVVLSGCVRRDRLGLFWGKESKAKAAEAMEMLGIADLSSKSFGALSGGQRQRVLLARAVCASSKLLLLDEPVTGLDPEAAHSMYEAIGMLNRERGCSVMMVSHDIQCALREADHVLSLCRGHSFYGTVGEYGGHEAHDSEIDEELHHHIREHEHHEHSDKGEENK